MAESKITGSSIFSPDVLTTFQKFQTEVNESATSVLQLRDAIVKLNNAMKGSGGLSILQGKVNKELVEYNTLLKETNKLEKKRGIHVNNSKNQMKSFARASRSAQRSMGGLMMSFRSLLGAAGFAGLTYSLIQVGRNIFNNVKRLDAMNLALQKVTKSTYEFAESKAFLSRMSQRLGLDILKTAKSYATFRAAAQQSNLTMGETMEIFESFADVGANLALTSSEMGSIFLALEQMLSKGKVSTEELRRQLGEKLPGAMGIMAQALGVTTGELDKMLRKGEVLTEDALPKFAKQVRKVYGVDMKKDVDTLQASVNRLSNAWIAFVENLDENGIGDFLSDAVDSLTMMLKLTEEIAAIIGERGPGSVWNVMTEAFENTVEDFSVLFDGLARFAVVLADITPPGWINALISDKSFTERAFGEDGQDGFNIDFDKIRERIRLEREQNRLADEKRDSDAERIIITERLAVVTDVLNKEFGANVVQQLDAVELSKLSNEQIKQKIEFIDKQIISIDKQRKALAEASKEEEERIKKRAASKLGLPTEQFAIDAGTKGPDFYGAFYQKIQDILSREIPKFEAKAQEIRDHLLLFPDDSDAKKELDGVLTTLKGFYAQAGSLIQPLSTDALVGAAEGAGHVPGKGANAGSGGDGDEPIQFLGVNLDGGPDSWTKRLEYVQDFADQIAKLEDAAFQRREMQIAAEEKQMRDKYDNLQRLAEGDDELQKKLRIRQEEEQKKIEKKKKKLKYDEAKANRRQALIDIAINTAVAVAKAYSQTGVFGLAAQIPILAMGVLQAGVVLATPLPAYAEGTDFHEGGPAILGDGGKEELVFTPDGKTILTKDTPEVMDLPRGTKVVADAQKYIQEQTLKAIIESDRRLDEMIVDKVAKAVQKGFAGVNINNSVTVKNSSEFAAYRYKLLN